MKSSSKYGKFNTKIAVIILSTIVVAGVTTFGVTKYNASKKQNVQVASSNTNESEAKKEEPKNDDKISKDSYDKVNEGMTLDDVKGILGDGQKSTITNCNFESNAYSWKNQKGDYFISLFFVDNKVAFKADGKDISVDKSQITLENYKKVHFGMTYDEVRDILNDAPIYLNNTGITNLSWTHGGDECLFISFKDNKVVKYSALGFHKATTLSKDSYGKINNGMTLEEAIATFGNEEPVEYKKLDNGQIECSWANWVNNSTTFVILTLDNNKVINKRMQRASELAEIQSDSNVSSAPAVNNQAQAPSKANSNSNKPTVKTANKRLTYNQFLSIKIGMSHQEVINILGEGTTITKGFYFWRDNNKNLSIEEENNKVRGKSQSRLNNIYTTASEAKFKAVKVGLTLNQVNSLLGPGELRSAYPVAFSYSWIDSHGREFSASFKNGKVDGCGFEDPNMAD